jgi:uroporphyrin-III C-methyltransferase / precorrin-2 dehydrogenase / sirohydrochlorin ferrochelatase
LFDKTNRRLISDFSKPASTIKSKRKLLFSKNWPLFRNPNPLLATVRNPAMRYFPMFLDLKNRKALVVGGGEEALRKVRLLLKTEALIEVVATELHPELTDMSVWGSIYWLGHGFHEDQLDGAALVFVASDDETNERVSAAARARSIPVNVVDEPDLSTAITPAIVDRDPLVIAIGSEGAAPILAQGVRARVESMLPPQLGAYVKRAESLRERVAEHVPFGNRRRAFWTKFFFGPLKDIFISGNGDFNAELDKLIADEAHPAQGRVSLVGAGPGDPELMTLKAQRRLQEADVIVYDRLVGPGILEYARRDATRIAVGKTPHQPSPKQADINAILIREAKAGKLVVRLKGGDPYVFGRGGEEQAILEAEGIPVDVVPGITAALGCAASIGLTVTHRGQNRSFTLLTGAGEDGVVEHDWASLARPGNAFAIYMGVGNAGHIAQRLIEAGIDTAVPVTVVENGTLANERSFVTSIARLGDAMLENNVAGPAIIYIGLAKAAVSADVLSFPGRDNALQRAAS